MTRDEDGTHEWTRDELYAYLVRQVESGGVNAICLGHNQRKAWRGILADAESGRKMREG